MEREFGLKDYIYILFKRKSVLFTFFFSLVVIVTIASCVLPPTYRAESTLLVEKAEEEPLVPVKRAISDFVDRVSLITTQVELVTSRRVLEKVVKCFSLDEKLSIKGKDRFEKAIIFLKKNIKVVPVKNTDFMKIRLDLKDKELVAPVVNAIAQYYIKCYYEIREEHSSDVVGFIDSQIAVIKDKLASAEQDLCNYEKANRIVSLRDEQWVYLWSFVDEQRKLIQLRQDYSDSHPDVVASKTQLQLFKEKLRSLPEKKVKIRHFERLVQNHWDIYLMLLKKKEEMRIAAEMEKNKIGNIRTIQVVDPAGTPIKPYWPKKHMNVLIAIILGISGGIGLCFWAEYLDHRIYTRGDVKIYLGLPVVGTVRSSNQLSMIQATLHPSVLSFYRHLWADINVFWPREARTLLITGPSRQEGKTVTAVNLALLLSKEKKVLLIDANSAHPHLHHIFKTNYKPGLAGLSGADAIHLKNMAVATNVKNLWIVPYGSDGASDMPVDIKDVISFIDRAKKEFDYVIIDSSGCATHSVALLIAPAVDYMLFVVKAGFTRREAAVEGLERLRRVREDGWGIVLNGQRYYLPEYLYKRL